MHGPWWPSSHDFHFTFLADEYLKSKWMHVKMFTEMHCTIGAQDLYLPQDRGEGNFWMGTPSPIHGRCEGLGRASGAGDPQCAATAQSLPDWRADVCWQSWAAAAWPVWSWAPLGLHPNIKGSSKWVFFSWGVWLSQTNCCIMSLLATLEK